MVEMTYEPTRNISSAVNYVVATFKVGVFGVGEYNMGSVGVIMMVFIF